MSKTLMVLGGAAKSLPLLIDARRKGHRILLCDRDPDAPCRSAASDFLEVSTRDVDALVAAAREHGVDGVLSFGSDRMAEVAAEVAERCGLPGNPPEAIRTMGRKDLFRAFLREHGFNAPRSAVAGDAAEMRAALEGFALPLILKPVDSAGSTGVTRIDAWSEFAGAFGLAKAASAAGLVIAEEFLVRSHAHVIAGDAFVVDGRVAFWGLLNSHRGAHEAPFLPTGTSFPILLAERRRTEVRAAVQALVDALGLRQGPLNLELIYTRDNRLHIIEVAPRNGGNHIPELLGDATGVDLIGALVDSALGGKIRFASRPQPSFAATYVVHTQHAGRFRAIEFDPSVRPYIYRAVPLVRPGDDVRPFDRATHAVGVLFLDFASSAEQQAMLARMNACVHVALDGVPGSR